MSKPIIHGYTLTLALPMDMPAGRRLTFDRTLGEYPVSVDAGRDNTLSVSGRDKASCREACRVALAHAGLALAEVEIDLF
jgi:hypothetical protein